MARIDVILEKAYYTPGEKIKGSIFVGTSKKIDCKKLEVFIEGELKSSGSTMEYVTKSKKSKQVHTALYNVHQDSTEITRGVAFDPGTHKFEFSFRTLSDAKLSYEGHNGHIRYTITAIMNVSRISKVTGKKRFIIYKPVNEIVTAISNKKTREAENGTVTAISMEKTREVAEHEGENILEVEIDTLQYCVGKNLTFRYLVNTDMKFNDLRVEIEHVEITHLPEKTDVTHSGIVQRESIRNENVIRHEWQTWTLKIDKEFPVLVRNNFIVSGLNLKVIVGRSFRFDKAVTIGLAAGHCPRVKEISDPNADVPKGIPKPARVRCKKCSYTFKLKDDDIDYSTCPSCGKQVFL